MPAFHSKKKYAVNKLLDADFSLVQKLFRDMQRIFGGGPSDNNASLQRLKIEVRVRSLNFLRERVLKTDIRTYHNLVAFLLRDIGDIAVFLRKIRRS